MTKPLTYLDGMRAERRAILRMIRRERKSRGIGSGVDATLQYVQCRLEERDERQEKHANKQ